MTHDINALVAELTALRLPELKARYEQVLGKPTRCPNRTYLVRSICSAVQEQAADAAQESTETVTEANDEEAITLSDDDVEDAEELDAAEDAGNDAVEPLAAEDDDATEDEPTAPAPEAPETESATTAHPRRERRPKPERQPRGRFSGMTVEELQRMYVEVVGRPTSSSHRAYLSWKIREAEKGRVPVGPRQSRARQGEPADVKILPLRLEAEAVEAMDAAWRDRGMKTRMEFLRRALGHYLTHIGAADAAAKFGGDAAA